MRYDLQPLPGPAWTAEEIGILNEIGEYFGAGFLAPQTDSIIHRAAHGIENAMARYTLEPYTGTKLYPRGIALRWWTAPVFSYFYVMMTYDRRRLDAALAAPENSPESSPARAGALRKYRDFLEAYPWSAGHTHSIPNYGRLLREGAEGLLTHVAGAAARYAGDADRAGFLDGARITAGAIRALAVRIRAHIAVADFRGDPEEAVKEANRRTLLDGYDKIAAGGTETFAQAMVAANFWFYIDQCDGYGRFDRFMLPYYESDVRNGAIGDEDVIAWLDEAWHNIDRMNGYQVALGGTRPEDGGPAYSRLTELCMKAGQGKRRPNMALRVRSDMPDSVWDAALDCIRSGNGMPALYSDENYLKGLENAHLNLSLSDRRDFAFGGCTETMVHGCSNVGSLDADIQALLILEKTIREKLEDCSTFDEFYNEYKSRLSAAVGEMCGRVSRYQEIKAKWHPQMIRSLLIDDCIDAGTEYAAGGARCNWSVNVVIGLSNVIDSLAALRETVYGDETAKWRMSAAEMKSLLESDFADDPEARLRLLALPKYGNGIPEVDALGADIAAHINTELVKYSPWRGGKFISSCIMFATYVDFGRRVGATPDGRRAGDAVGDSAGAYQGRDKNGPTALFGSVCRLDLLNSVGTPVVNIRFSKKILSERDSRDKLRQLITSYFGMGGMQLQINVVDQQTLAAAIKDPEAYGSLVVRLGGYSEYFRLLSDKMKLTILERTIHEV